MGALICIGGIYVADYRREDEIFDAKLKKYEKRMVKYYRNFSPSGRDKLSEIIFQQNKFIERYLIAEGLISKP